MLSKTTLPLDRLILRALFTAVALLMISAANAEDRSASPPSLEKIADNVWVHKSYMHVKPWGLILSQGMVVKTSAGVFLVDTAWNNSDTEDLLDLIVDEIGETPKAAIITHAHDDKMGGVGALNKRGVPTIMHHWTERDAPKRGLEVSSLSQSKTFYKDENIPAEPIRVTDREGLFIHYPGPGHTRDNIVVYFEPARVLFGGCLIRPRDVRGLGNTADGSVSEWAATTRNVANTFPDAEIVIPSHGPMAGRALLSHTAALAEKAVAK